MIGAKIVADSVNTSTRDRITTFVLTYPRFIHAEVMTHRLFSRNAASSRAIPTAKLIKQVADNPALPVEWGRNQSGMQAFTVLNKKTQHEAKREWLRGAKQAIETADRLHSLGVHKQIANRPLEPYLWMSTLVTATEYENWFAQRDDIHAQPDIRTLAQCMKAQMEFSNPRHLDIGDWHLPFVDEELTVKSMLKLSAARCARISYLNHDGSYDLTKDFALYMKLHKSGHWSPFEHQAQALEYQWRSGTFVGWRQHRKLHGGEHRGRNIDAFTVDLPL